MTRTLRLLDCNTTVFVNSYKSLCSAKPHKTQAQKHDSRVAISRACKYRLERPSFFTAREGTAGCFGEACPLLVPAEKQLLHTDTNQGTGGKSHLPKSLARQGGWSCRSLSSRQTRAECTITAPLTFCFLKQNPN